MRCYFVKNGHISDVEELIDMTEEEAIKRARLLFEARQGRADGFELWDRSRILIQYPEQGAPARPGAAG